MWLVEAVFKTKNKNQAWKAILFYGAGAILAKIWADFFGAKISHFWSVLKILSVVFNFLLSSPRFDHEDSDSEHERFQKILSQKFECRSGLAHGAKFRKFHKIRYVVRV